MSAPVVDLSTFLREDLDRVTRERDDLIRGYVGDIRLSDLVGYVWYQADQPCRNPGLNVRCAVSAMGDRSWMCPTCWARDITYGPICLKCRVNHRSKECA